MRGFRLAGCHVPLLFTLAVAPSVAAQVVTPAGEWKGSWTAPEGWAYAAALRLSLNSDATVEGSITWTLKRSPRSEEQAKIGLTGVEHVRGTYDSRCRVARLEGYRLDDPNSILGIDRYELVLAQTGNSLGGITWHHGPWTGQLLLTR